MLDSLGQSVPKPRLLGTSMPSAESRSAFGSAETRSPYHFATFVEAHPVKPEYTDVQKNAWARERSHRDAKAILTPRWQAYHEGGSNKPPFALSLDEDQRALPSLGRGRAAISQAFAGMATPRDLLGAQRLGGLTDFGLSPTPQPRNRPVGKERLKEEQKPMSARATNLDHTTDLGRCSFFDCNSQMMRHRELLSKPVNLGFSFPKNEAFRRASVVARAGKINALERLGEYYPLNHSVLQAQYRLDGCDLCL